jgi:peptide/nickel transport system substrate-binding protein
VPFLASLTTHQAFPVVSKGSLAPGPEKIQMYPPGTGPFQMVEHRSNQLIALKRFDHYWQKGIPYLDAIHFRPIEDDTVRLTALRTEELDAAERVPHDQALRIRKGELKVLGLKVAEASGYLALIFNTETSPFHHVKLRQAVAYAIDKPKIIDGISWGFGAVSDQKVLKGSRWFVPTKDRERDLGKARALLKEAGYPTGLKVKGHAPRLKSNHDAMQIILSQLRDVGIEIDLEIKDFVTHQNAFREGKFTITVMGGLPYIDPDLAYYQYFHTEKNPIRVSNFARYSNPRVDRLLDEGRTEADFQKRYRIYKEVLEILNEELPQVSLGYVPYVFGFRNYVKDFDVYPNDQFFYGVGGLAMTWLDR